MYDDLLSGNSLFGEKGVKARVIALTENKGAITLRAYKCVKISEDVCTERAEETHSVGLNQFKKNLHSIIEDYQKRFPGRDLYPFEASEIGEYLKGIAAATLKMNEVINETVELIRGAGSHAAVTYRLNAKGVVGTVLFKEFFGDLGGGQNIQSTQVIINSAQKLYQFSNSVANPAKLQGPPVAFKLEGKFYNGVDDIAYDAGEMYALADSKIYSVNKNTGKMKFVMNLDSEKYPELNSLTFLPTYELLVAGDGVWKIDLVSSAITEVVARGIF